MKFHYEYRTSDNVRHSGVVNAATKDAAFAVLKRQGIRPCRFSEAPGFFNKLFGKGKRWAAIVVLVIAVLAVLMLARDYKGKAEKVELLQESIFATTRHQVIGDQAIIDIGIRTGWANVFSLEGERFLASYAIPAAKVGLRNTTEDELEAALSRVVEVSSEDGIEARQIKAMVEGMKEEARRFVDAGGSLQLYGKQLIVRQEQEQRYYNLAKMDVEKAVEAGRTPDEIEELLLKRNTELRQLGIGSLPMPEAVANRKIGLAQ